MRNMDFGVRNTKFEVRNTKFTVEEEERRPGVTERMAAVILSFAMAFGGGVALDAQDAHADKQQKETESLI